jgi:hypothetical protein
MTWQAENFGPHEILTSIGAGGAGEVYKRLQGQVRA